MISSSQRPQPDNTQHSQQTNIHAPGGIRSHDLSRRTAADLRVRPRGYWDRHHIISYTSYQTRVPESFSRRAVVALCVSVGYVRKVVVMPTAGYSSSSCTHTVLWCGHCTRQLPDTNDHILVPGVQKVRCLRSVSVTFRLLPY